MTVTTKITYRLAPEWASQSGVMLTWPHRDTIWADTLDDIDGVFVNVAREISQREKLLVVCFDTVHKEHVKNLLMHANVNLQNIYIFLAPCNDVWVRDHGPITVYRHDQPVLLDFVFNGWGNKYPADLDNHLTRTLHQQKAFGMTPMHAVKFVLEGGSIETDGAGTLMTTSRCLLSPERNPALKKPEINQLLADMFGVQQVLWLDYGKLAGDDTDGHIDTLARFVDEHTICYIQCDDPADEHYFELQAMKAQLETFTNVYGIPYRLIPLPMPKPRYAAYDGRRLPATYANFLIINHAILVPTYDDPADHIALSTLKECFPGRDVIAIDCSPVIQWYGSLHCMTMQLPHGVLS